MRPNLDSLSEEIQQYLEAEHFVVFRSMTRALESPETVWWDSERHPDFRQFLDVALKLGLRLISFHHREFSAIHREDAIERLEEADLPRDAKRALERRINELQIYEGFTCALELSFDFEGRLYVFELETEWYEEWHEAMDEIEDAMPDDEGEEPNHYGGYFSNN